MLRKTERNRENMPIKEGNVWEGSSQKENKAREVERNGRKMTDRWRK